MTTITKIFRLLHEGLNYTTIARACHVSVTTVIRYCSRISISRPKELPTVLGIDEFRDNATGQKYRVILTDPDSHNVIDVLPKKETNALCRYFASHIFERQGKERITYHLKWWLKSVKTAQLQEFRNFSTSFVSWKGQITNAFLLPFSNGYTEGCNNKIKVLKRISYGLRHFGRFRTRILLLSKKNDTEHNGVRCQKNLLVS